MTDHSMADKKNRPAAEKAPMIKKPTITVGSMRSRIGICFGDHSFFEKMIIIIPAIKRANSKKTARANR